jgi:hypothetical protein
MFIAHHGDAPAAARRAGRTFAGWRGRCSAPPAEGPPMPFDWLLSAVAFAVVATFLANFFGE